MQSSYKSAVESWMAANREEEALAPVDHSEAESVKKANEDALREEFFGF
jgi:hypothetical protein